MDPNNRLQQIGKCAAALLLALVLVAALALSAPVRAQSGGEVNPLDTPTLVLSPASRVFLTAGFNLSITGQVFVKGYQVQWEGVPLTTRYISKTRLIAAVPASKLVTPGAYTVQVINPADDTLIGQQVFVVGYPKPRVTTLSPSYRYVSAPDFTLTIYGSGFVNGVTHAHWNGVEIPSTFVSKTRLKVLIHTADLGAQGGPIEVRITNPTPGGGTSSRMFSVRNPIPSLISISPSTATTSSSDLTVTLTGTNFVPTSFVRISAQPLVTTFVDKSHLTAVIPGSMLGTARALPLNVRSPAPGGGSSRSIPLKVSQAAKYVLLGWNDLGMHCYNRDFADLAVLPPYNTLWAQVIKLGNPPQIVTQGVTVSYSFPENTYSGADPQDPTNLAKKKSNFWDFAQKLFGLAAPLPADTGLTGIGLAGNMAAKSDHFEAVGIPLTEYRDSDLLNRYPYQKAEMVAKDSVSGQVLATLTVVAPVSTEMTCNECHSDGQRENISTGKVETNILTLHDLKEGSKYPADYTGKLMDAANRPVLCASCHSSNALGAAGKAGIPSLANAMHDKHAGEVPDTKAGCYKCHPGPETQCLRDVMSVEENMTCIDCHGGLAKVAQNPNPWLNEPRCDGCHSDIKQNAALYRFSKDHGGVYCEACHDSTHAIAPSSQSNDAIKFVQLQGHGGPLGKCTVCHLTQPSGRGPHGGSGD